MDGKNGNKVGAVLGVEVIEVGGVLEVVGQDGAVLYHVIGDDIVAVFLNIKGDILGGEDLLGYGKDLGVGGGGGGYGDGLAGDGGIIKVGVIAVTGVFHDGNWRKQRRNPPAPAHPWLD